MSVDTEPRPLTIPQQKNAALVEEILFLLSCDVGEAGILAALGYTRNAPALKRRLYRIHRTDLVPRIFEADAAYADKYAEMGITRKARP